jgi:hypothetical protein
MSDMFYLAKSRFPAYNVMMMWTASPRRHLVPKCGRRRATERETVHERVYTHRAGFGQKLFPGSCIS